MNNKTNIEEDIKIVEEMLKDKEEIIKYHTWIGNNAIQAIENILADRERLEKEKEIHIKLEQQYKKEYLDEKAKYDSLVDEIKEKIICLKKYKAKLEAKLANVEMGINISLIEEDVLDIENQIKVLQELLDTKEV